MEQPKVVRGMAGVETGPDTSLLQYRCAFMSLYTPDAANTDLCLSKGVASPQCSTKPRNSHHQAFVVPRAYSSSPVSSMNPPTRSPSIEAMKAIITHALPNVSIESIKPLAPARPQRDVGIKISDGRTLLLTLPPSPMLRLLRSEQWLVLSEALVIPWICSRVLERTARDKRISIQYLIDAEPGRTEHSKPTNFEKSLALAQSADESMIQYLPALISHSSLSPELGTSFNLLEPPRGLAVNDLPRPLSELERASVEYQKGEFIRRISKFKAPDSKFGPAVSIIGPYSSSTDSNIAAALAGSGGVDTWSKAFLALMEGTLRDGEDLAVTISYSLIRHHMQRLGHLLDAVTQSRLVVLDAGSDSNVLVSRSKNSEQFGEVEALSSTRTQISPESSNKMITTIKTEFSEKETYMAVGSEAGPKQATETSNIAVTGLRGWSNCIFGDPLMTSVFSEEPSAELLRGFGQPSSTNTTPATSPTTYGPRTSSPLPNDLIEDCENAPVRLLLYECYHAAVSVVKQFYRPRSARDTTREMAARRRLAAVLNKLAEVDDNVLKRPRTASVDIWPVKKPKSETSTGGFGW